MDPWSILGALDATHLHPGTIQCWQEIFRRWEETWRKPKRTHGEHEKRVAITDIWNPYAEKKFLQTPTQAFI